uniref:Pre-mRNA-splicing factor 38 n=1 Tax=Cacopsylla melanoneura TaxID=428564 RepID=A0A8D8M168_9HEMI
MANRTVKDARSVRGTNPQYLIEKIIRARIYDSKYWKEECFALTAELLVDKAMELRYIGGVYGGNIKPTPFLCLVLKLLQIQPEKDIVVQFIKNEEFKYVRALGAYYMRLTGTSVDCYKYLEPLFADSRKLRFQNRQGAFEVIHVDEFIDQLLREERMCDIILPRIQKRHVLEENNEIEVKVSILDDDIDDGGSSSSDEEIEEEGEIHQEKNRMEVDSHSYHNSKYDSYHREMEKERDRRHRSEKSTKDRGRDRSRSKERDRRHRSKSPRYKERDHDRDRHKDYDREKYRDTARSDRRDKGDRDRRYDRR